MTETISKNNNFLKKRVFANYLLSHDPFLLYRGLVQRLHRILKLLMHGQFREFLVSFLVKAILPLNCYFYSSLFYDTLNKMLRIFLLK